MRLKRASVPIQGTQKSEHGLHYRILAVVKTGQFKSRQQWRILMDSLGLEWSRVTARPDNEGVSWADEEGEETTPPPVIDHEPDRHGDVAAWETSYEVWGHPEALTELTSGCHKVLVRWEYVRQDAHSPLTSIGREKRPMSSKPKAKKPHDGGAFREIDAARKSASETWDQWLTKNGMQGIKID